MESESSSSGSARTRSPKPRLHWHVVLTHFPISAFTGAFLFMGLHVLTKNGCLTLAAYVTLLASAAVLIPTTATGWFTWKRRYRGSKSKLFLIKIWIAAAMIPISVGLVVYQTTHPFAVLDVSHRVGHLVYFVGVMLLMVGAMAEGYWGGHLHHR